MNKANPATEGRPAPSGPGLEMRRAWGGLWSLVWRSRLNLRRAPRLLPLYLILPGLAVLLGKTGGDEAYLQIVLNLQLSLAVPLLSLITMATPIRDEAEQGTLAYLNVRPLNRGVFFLLFHASHLLWLELSFLLSGLLLLGAGFWLQIPDITGLIFPYLVAQIAGVFAFSSLSAVIGLLTRRYLILGLIYGAVIEIGVGGIPTNINVLSLAHHVRVIVSSFEPAAFFLRANQGNAFFSFFVLAFVGLTGAGIAAMIYNYHEFIAGPDA